MPPGEVLCAHNSQGALASESTYPSSPVDFSLGGQVTGSEYADSGTRVYGASVPVTPTGESVCGLSAGPSLLPPFCSSVASSFPLQRVCAFREASSGKTREGELVIYHRGVMGALLRRKEVTSLRDTTVPPY